MPETQQTGAVRRLTSTMTQIRPVLVQLLRPLILLAGAALLIEGLLPALLSAQAGPPS
jgi:hypothetical protein